MNRAEMEKARQSLFIGDLNYFESKKLWTKEQKQLDKEICCREMIDSCLVYGTDFWTQKSYNVLSPYEYLKESYVADLGLKRVQELYEEQKAYIDSCDIVYGAYTDNEGCTYNQVIEKSVDDEN